MYVALLERSRRWNVREPLGLVQEEPRIIQSVALIDPAHLPGHKYLLTRALLDSSHWWLCAHYLATLETHCMVER